MEIHGSNRHFSDSISLRIGTSYWNMSDLCFWNFFTCNNYVKISRHLYF